MTVTPSLGHIFISYRRVKPDLSFARRLRKDLIAAGHHVWIDVEGIEGGEIWNDEIQNALDRCYAYILILSPEALKSRWVRNELLYALQEKQDRVYPVLLRHVKVPPEIIAIQYIDFTSDYHSGLKSLLCALPSVSHLLPIPFVKREKQRVTRPVIPAKANTSSVAGPSFLRRWWRVPAVLLPFLFPYATVLRGMSYPLWAFWLWEVLVFISMVAIAFSHLLSHRWFRGGLFVLNAAFYSTHALTRGRWLDDLGIGWFGYVVGLMMLAGILWTIVDALRKAAV